MIATWNHLDFTCALYRSVPFLFVLFAPIFVQSTEPMEIFKILNNINNINNNYNNYYYYIIIITSTYVQY